ncbi:translation initiation factor 2 [Catellatospora chokoriensis]|uniref:Leucine rich repeat (LRR) protein n=1 Tax=Catellatospora chokoriensis TaxID=310353 RepID=A0A8J3K099_9ACTN|nr:translation initiation factor 2 [Catellatospora chokoriensis]GIF88158.1 hypothetical protein Cch02nite_16020 [Catellatospora chokoriensis]
MREEILSGVAANPGAPVDVLLRLLAVEAQACWDVLCIERDLPVEVVDAVLSHPDRAVRRRISRNHHLAPAQRARLIDDPDPMTPATLIYEPGQWPTGTVPRPLPDDVVRRLLATSFPLLSAAELLSELAFTHFGRQTCEIAATHPLPGIRALACGYRGAVSDERWLALQRDPDPQVRAAAEAANARDDAPAIEPAGMPPRGGRDHWLVLQCRRLSRTVLDQLVTGTDPVDLRFLARNPYLPPDVVEQLLSDPDASVRGATAGRADLAPDQLLRLAADVEEAVRIAVSVHPGLSESQRAAIVVGHWPDEHFNRHRPGLPPELTVGIAHAYSVNPLLRRRAASDPRLPQAVADRLAEDPDAGVRVRLALCHPAPPPALLLRSYLEYDGPDRLHLTTRPGFPVAGLARFAGDPDPALRLLALLDPEVPAAVVDGLLADPARPVWTAAARHPRLPTDRLRDLLGTERARHAAANPALDAATLHGLLDAARIPATPRQARSGP